MSPLNLAIENLDAHAVAALVAGGAAVNRPEPELGGCSPLQHAVDIESEESCRRDDAGDPDAAPRATITRMLVLAGADPEQVDSSGASARSWAEQRRHDEALRLFDQRREIQKVT